MRATSRKLRELENNIVDFKVEDGSTMFSNQCMSAGEIELHNKAGKLMKLRKDFANELCKKLESNPEADVSEITKFFNEKEQTIVDASQRLYLLRALDVMNMALFQYIHFNQPMQKALFYIARALRVCARREEGQTANSNVEIPNEIKLILKLEKPYKGKCDFCEQIKLLNWRIKYTNGSWSDICEHNYERLKEYSLEHEWQIEKYFD
jgi:hypothetical protein